MTSFLLLMKYGPEPVSNKNDSNETVNKCQHKAKWICDISFQDNTIDSKVDTFVVISAILGIVLYSLMILIFWLAG